MKNVGINTNLDNINKNQTPQATKSSVRQPAVTEEFIP